MNKVPDCMVTFTLSKDSIDEWLDTFDPGSKTFAANFIINILPQYRFDIDALTRAGYGEIMSCMGEHYNCFLSLKVMDMFPGHTLSSWRLAKD